MSRRAGKVGALYYQASAISSTFWSDSGWLHATSVKDATFNGETGEADVSARDNVFRATVPTLIDGSIEFTMPWDDDDTVMDAFREAWLDQTPIAVAALSDTIANDGQGPFGNFYVTNFTREEPLEDAMIANVTLRFASYQSWKNTGS